MTDETMTMTRSTEVDDAPDLFGWRPSDPPYVEEAPKRRRQKAYAGPTRAELLMLFDPTRTFFDEESRLEAKRELEQLEAAGLKPKKSPVKTGGRPRGRKLPPMTEGTATCGTLYDD